MVAVPTRVPLDDAADTALVQVETDNGDIPGSVRLPGDVTAELYGSVLVLAPHARVGSRDGIHAGRAGATRRHDGAGGKRRWSSPGASACATLLASSRRLDEATHVHQVLVRESQRPPRPTRELTS